jgi:hypothetical protein
VPVRVYPSADGVGCVYGFDCTPAEPGPDDYVDVADYDASGILVARRRLPAAEAYRYLPHPMEAEWLGWDPCTGAHPGPGRWLTGEESDAQGDLEPPAPSGKSKRPVSDHFSSEEAGQK